MKRNQKIRNRMTLKNMPWKGNAKVTQKENRERKKHVYRIC